MSIPVRVDGQLEGTGFFADALVDLLEPKSSGQHQHGLVRRCLVDYATGKDLAGSSYVVVHLQATNS